MDRRHIALAALGGVGAAALTARRHSPALDPPLPGDHDTYRWRGMDVAYTSAGDPENPDVVCLHGIHAAASSVEFDAVWPHLTDHYHVLAPDLPGFGRSDRPPITYDASLYEAFIADFTDDRTTTPLVVASGLTGAYTAAVATDRVAELVLVCPTDTTTNTHAWLGDVIRTPGIGSVVFAGVTTPASLRWWLAHDAYENPANVTPALLEYLHHTARQPGARYAPAAFIAGDLDPAHRLVDTLSVTDTPLTLVWGRNATRTPLGLGETLAATTNSPLVVVDDARRLPHSEHPTTVVDGLATAAVLPRS